MSVSTSLRSKLLSLMKSDRLFLTVPCCAVPTRSSLPSRQLTALSRRNLSVPSRYVATLPVERLKLDDPLAESVTTSPEVSPYQIVEKDLLACYREIKADLACDLPELVELAQYYFTAHGKAFRPMVVLLMAEICAKDSGGVVSTVAAKQRRVAVITEMIHTASLIHDDVIDEADTRRNQPSLHKVWGEKKAILAGDYILSVASRELAKLRNPDVIICLAQVIEDLVKGELMQIGSKDGTASSRLTAYLSKTYYKTASLLANSCKAVAMLSNCSEEAVERCYQFGKTLGMAFQLVDDKLDFVATADDMGKPTAVDLTLGLATAPVLFAAEKDLSLDALIQRRFSKAGDVSIARQAVIEHKGVDQTHNLAGKYCQEATKCLSSFQSSREKDALLKVIDMVLTRSK
ncbi:hypothetical protein RvY_13737 [Ramazzottius varieornatus]|uniref:Decaprenyl-diphosphate synthase subunit 1 n=1 Tax=Ramazzottius varieornatus TaxID=947166 RepID=A0A1D1VNX2_RAMVA|nr:hypothetical protein RvY_13737 [Ramazzottius varieornatus]